MDTLGEEARNLLLHPLVLNGAWRKLRDVYRSPWMRHEEQWLEWSLDPWAKMVRVASQLAAGEYRVSKFDLVPYPKRGGRVRQYLRPTVDDEFAFLLLGVLLTPMLEARFWPFSYGSRWHRSVVRRPPPGFADDPTWKLDLLPYTLSDRRVFLSYRRSYGLFRRVAHWTAQRMLKVDWDTHPSGGGPHLQPQDYPDQLLPYLHVGKRRSRFRTGVGIHGTLQAYYARLDLASAFPCVRRKSLRTRVESILDEPLPDARRRTARAVTDEPWRQGDPMDGLYRQGSPWRFLESSEGEEARRQLLDCWMSLLDSVRYGDAFGVGGAWRPTWAPEKNRSGPADPGPAEPEAIEDGIPTGLTVSGVWFNAYLHPLDSHMASVVGLSNDGGPISGAYFRFVDDIILLAPSRRRLHELVDGVAGWLKSGGHGGMDERWVERNNLVLSAQKAEPAYLRSYLETRHGEVTNAPAAALETQADSEEGEAPPCAGRITPDSLGPLVTTLVEAFSELGRPTLHEVFGTEAGRRLSELHRLARLTIEDTEVRLDTRMAFVGLRLATAPLPFAEEEEAKATSAEAAHKELQRSVRTTVLRTPWKYGLWLAVFRLGFRLLALHKGKHGEKWLRSMLSLLRPGGLLEGEAWGPCEEDSSSPAPLRAQARALSFLRGSVWTSYALVVRDIAKAVGQTPDGGHARWAPTHWAFPLMKRDQAEEGLQRLVDLFDSLPEWMGLSQSVDELNNWERERFEDARWSTRLPSDVVKGVRSRPYARLVRRWKRCRPSEATVAKLLRGRFHNAPGVHLWLSEQLGLTAWLTVEELRRGVDAVSSTPWRDLRFQVTGLSEAQRSRLERWHVLEVYRRIHNWHSASFGLFQSEVVARSWKQLPFSGRLQLRPSLSAEPSLWELLRGRLAGVSADELWAKRPPDRIPALGVPPKAVLQLLRSAMKHDWRSEHGVTWDWLIEDGAWVRAETRRRRWLMGEGRAEDPTRMELQDARTLPAVVGPAKGSLPHPLFVLLSDEGIRTTHGSIRPSLPDIYALWAAREGLPAPEWETDSDDPNLAVLCNLLVALVAVSGSSRPLDAILDSWPVVRPPSTNFGWRDRYAMPEAFWRLLDSLLTAASAVPGADDPAASASLVGELLPEGGGQSASPLSVVAVDLRPTGGWEHVAGHWVGEGGEPGASGTEKLAQHKDVMVVRIGQIETAPTWSKVVSDWPDHPNPLAVLRSITDALPFRSVGDDASDLPDLVLLPEVSVPPRSERLLESTVKRYGYGILAGRYWVEHHHQSSKKSSGPQWITNDALLLLPVHREHRPGLVRRFVIRKPLPNHEEHGLAVALTDKYQKARKRSWRMLRGTEVYRFLHPEWGDFTVGICSDLIDPGPWRRLRGLIQHFFLVACNQDAATFHAMTRTRAYELYANLAMVNHGYFGGSYAWSPERGHRKERARFDGAHLHVVSDIELPVRSLVDRQKHAWTESVSESAKDWPKDPGKPKPKFKAPPPEFRAGKEDQ